MMVALYVLAHIMMSRMALGRYIYAVGGNEHSAELSGESFPKASLSSSTRALRPTSSSRLPS